ncbi:5'/3'-nucleotidase SurE [Calorimonas adulescens]|jgi:5'/3'-nucleotidase SurE|uniref:5'-nucleotidase SurE n=1 Tax=Calorimonas adulescens TaxID=2606906 RepID=A0A5D8QAL2_9THEO|nr:5'/3'-nucleotidase SurE [Calorimonas adulescens]TZE80816.1 5'/3'-nucleotidase SurE [Calorimonas adulescens]
MVLLTNDDGIYSPGIHNLAYVLSKIYEVLVVAPDKERSAVSHAITMHKPLRVSELQYYSNEKLYKSFCVNGTPADCVKLSMEVLLKSKPDFVISGINRGANLGTDIIYSGTVSAAIEAHFYGVPAIAVSIAEHENVRYDFTSYFICDLISSLLGNYDDLSNLLININIPGDGNIKKVKGIKVTTLGTVKYENSFEERVDPHHRKYYWLSGKKIDTNNQPGTDVNAIDNGFISLTPLRISLNDYKGIDSLNNLIKVIDLNKILFKMK